MASTKLKSSTAELLGKLYKNAQMGREALLGLLPKVNDVSFKSDLTLQLNGYEQLTEKINHLLQLAHEPSENDSLMQKVGAKVGCAMNTLLDSSVNHIADMVLQGSTMGMSDTIKLIREYENTNASEASLALAREMVSFEEQNIERLKVYL